MTDTPSKQDQNILFLYSILTVNGSLNIDWDPVCAALELEKGAVTKRWSRLKQAMDKQEKPAASNEQLLWLMVKHSEREKGFDWMAIAEKCGSTKGTVSKRYSRMKLAFERGDARPPSTPTKSSKAAATRKKTPSKVKVKTEEDGEATPTTTPKRKHTPSKKKVGYTEADEDEDEDEEDEKPKRAKSTPKTKPRPKNAFRASDDKKPSEEP
ncbi:hypothetical protein E8E11_002742 [Didymella keratinophila]|nr:hypothetical protein E8E11_002742 [Didymella keratinophila]